MQDSSTSRGGFDRVLMAVAATFLAVSATSALAQSDSSRSSAAELAIDAAIPVPEPANVPPPTAKDFKMDAATAAGAPRTDATKTDSAKTDSGKVDTAQTDSAKTGAAKTDTAKTELPKAATAAGDGANIDASKTAASPTTDGAKPAGDATAKTADTTPSADIKAGGTGKDDTAAAPSAPTVAPAAEPKATAQQPPQEPAKAASNVAPADQPAADKIKALLADKSPRFFDRKEYEDVEKFYAAREYAPIWTQAGKLTDNANGAIARLKDAAADGLDASDYPVPDFAAATTPDALADADLKLTDSVLHYARHAQCGRMNWSQVSADIQFPEHPIDPTEVLRHVTTAKDASAALDSYNPPQKLYQELKKKLAELRGERDKPVIKIADGPALKYTPSRKRKQPAVAVEDPRVPQLRAKLGIAENADDDHYDAKVAEAVRRFQENADLRPTGVLDARTVAAINSPKRSKLIDTVIVNMERWRWLPRDLGAPSIGDAYVILNIPDYTLKVMQHGAQVWSTKVVTGKPGIHATPLLTETMKYITVNPTWNVPPSIVYGEYLPALQQDPTVLERMGLRVEQSPDGSVHISQPPGADNALGRIRFNFPNKFLVYQHDTPDKYLFAKTERAYSHGCMRVQYPDEYASILLNITEPNEHWTPERIRSMYGTSEIDLKFPTPIPVNITYQTAFVDQAGKLETRRDVYGRDATMLAMLKGPHTREMENYVAHAQPSYSHPNTRLPPGAIASEGGGGGFFSSGPSFFERLFGPPTPPPAPVGRRQREVQQRRIFTR